MDLSLTKLFLTFSRSDAFACWLKVKWKKFDDAIGRQLAPLEIQKLTTINDIGMNTWLT